MIYITGLRQLVAASNVSIKIVLAAAGTVLPSARSVLLDMALTHPRAAANAVLQIVVIAMEILGHARGVMKITLTTQPRRPALQKYCRPVNHDQLNAKHAVVPSGQKYRNSKTIWQRMSVENSIKPSTIQGLYYL